MSTTLASKDPVAVEPYFVVWCDEDGTNDGTASDKGELQSATIATTTWTLAGGTGALVKESENENAVTIAGVSYGADTVATIWLSAGVVNTDEDISCKITTSDSRTLDKTITIPIRDH